MTDTPEPIPVAPDATPDDEFKRRDEALTRALDKLEKEALEKTPKPPGVGAMF